MANDSAPEVIRQSQLFKRDVVATATPTTILTRSLAQPPKLPRRHCLGSTTELLAVLVGSHVDLAVFQDSV